MKKILGIIFFTLFLSFTNFCDAAQDIYPIVVTADVAEVTTSVGKFWRWVETRIHFSSNVSTYIYHTFISGSNPNHNVRIKTTFVNATQDTVIYPGATDDTAAGTVLLRDTDELKVHIDGTTELPYITIIGEEI